MTKKRQLLMIQFLLSLKLINQILYNQYRIEETFMDLNKKEFSEAELLYL